MVSMRSIVSYLVLLGSSVVVAAAPIVPSFERFHTQDDKQLADGGRLLLGELNCTSCHNLAGTLRDKKYVIPKRAPVLTNVGDRVRPERLRTMVANPLGTKPGTTMPDVLHGLPAVEKETKVEALVHFLASTATNGLRDAIPDKKAAQRGEKLFHEIGCTACHQPGDPKAAVIPTSVPIGDPSKKYTLDSLAKFLRDPLAVRPSGRMPSLNLTDKEARDVATWFLRNVEGEPNVRYEYYEGQFEKLPDFSKLTPTATGVCSGFDIEVAKRDNDYAIRFEAYLTLEKSDPLTFYMRSDDGSRLIIGDQVVIDNDGVHPPSEKNWEWKMQPGVHKIVIEYFNGGGGAELSLEMQSRGQNQPRLMVDSYVTASPTAGVPSAKKFAVDPAKVAQGRELYASLGCASCHELKENDKAVASTLTGPALDKIVATDRSCLAADAKERSNKTPNFGLSTQQTKAIVAAIADLKQVKIEQGKAPDLDSKQLIAHTLSTFNCIACHARDGRGGPEDARNELFLTTVKEMGDEGRIPPRLDGVGGKLTGSWMKQLLNEGSKDRAYMLTKMPRFSANNIGHLADPLYELDKLPPLEIPEINEPEYRIKGDGRMLIGAKGFSCIKCHNFDKLTAEGVPGINFTIFTKRLREEWFHRYVRDPQSFRPGTRMPSAWPKTGKSLLPRLLEGSCDKQIAAVWTYLKDGTKAAVPLGMGVDPIELVAGEKALIYRNFIEGSGPRAIGVAHPEKANFAFDADDLRLAIIWHGAFIDASKHWTARGSGFQTPLGDHILQLVAGPPLAVMTDLRASWPTVRSREMGYRLLGYKLGEQDRPTLRYQFKDITIEDYIRPASAETSPNLIRTLTLHADQSVPNLYFRAAAGNQIEAQPDGWYQIDKMWRMRIVTSGGAPIVRKGEKQTELLVPIHWQGTAAVIEQEFDW